MSFPEYNPLSENEKKSCIIMQYCNNRALIAVDSLDGLVPHPTKNMQSENKNTKQRDGSSSKLCQVMQPGLPKPGHDEMFLTQESLHPYNCFSRTPMPK